MIARLNAYKFAPDLMKALGDMEAKVATSGLDAGLVHLVKIRASQVNGCAFCIHMHTRDARAAGESEERIYLLDAWRELPIYSNRERAALDWTELVTLVSQTHVPDLSFDAVRAEFDEADLVKLTLVINMINAWNRMMISFRSIHPHKTRA